MYYEHPHVAIDVATIDDHPLVPAKAGHHVAVFGYLVQGHDTNTAQLRESADGSTFAALHGPMSLGVGTGVGNGIGGDTPVLTTRAGYGLYLTTTAAAQVSGELQYRYLPGLSPRELS